ncbi:pyridoxine biosynthesis protein [Orbilia blumenaviensis]|uniref:Pyridoxine biosynthesis protein n=1 Tax=Orbilia blumenaviensis TaxID=1796055 RepID=A0AAV9VMZ4_9PEZI
MASTMSSALRSSSRRHIMLLKARGAGGARGITTTPKPLKAHNFSMPALSPTMSEGTITSWRINEGDKFSAGDVILEVETDKAQMDVEAQDDGILAKIFVKASKDAVQVGTRIGVLADIDDDLSTLEIPPETSSTAAPPPPPPSSSSPPKESTTTPPPPTSSQKQESSPQSQSQQSQQKPKETRKNPFIPSPGLIHLLHTNSLTINDITGTGPQGRVLKGDILAHIGKIDRDKPKSLAGDIAKLGKLDLSNIVPKKTTPATTKQQEGKGKEEKKKERKPSPLEEVEVSLSISLTNTPSPLETSIARAVDAANAILPPSKIPPTADQLFDEILGLPSKPSPQPRYSVKTSDYTPPSASVVSTADLFDEIIGIAAVVPKKVERGGEKVQQFTVKVPAIDRDRAEFFLAKVKHSLEGQAAAAVL